MNAPIRRLLIASALTSGALGLAACGGGGGGSSDHSSPDGAVRGFIDALGANNINGALQWVNPSERSQFQSDLSQLQGIKFNISIQDFSVVSTVPDKNDPNKAVVHYKGRASFCVSGTPGGVPINTCEAAPFSPASGSDTIGAVKVNGDWYVSFAPSGAGPTPGAGSGQTSSTAASTTASVTAVASPTP
jgi:hypothetical protein